MKVYCIIVTYNGIKWIDRCLGSLKASIHPVKMIVIDNASVDGTANHIKKNFPEVVLIEAGANLGFGRANNIGLKRALTENADYIFLLNQDAFIAPDCIEILIQTSLANKEYGILSPFHLSYSGDAIEEYFNKYIIAFDAPGYINDLYFENVKKIYAVSFIHAAGWLLPIDTVKKVGGFDPLFFHYGEDNDYVQRLLFKQMKIVFVTDSILFHYGSNDGLNSPDKNIPFKINQSTIRLKNPNANMSGAILVFLKNSFDAITSSLLYRNFSQVKIEAKVFWYNLKRINTIAKSKSQQKREMAYLDM